MMSLNSQTGFWLCTSGLYGASMFSSRLVPEELLRSKAERCLRTDSHRGKTGLLFELLILLNKTKSLFSS